MRGTPEREVHMDHYKITVTSTELPTYAELCEAYDWVSEIWDETKFEQQLHESLRDITPPTGKITVVVKKFDRHTTSEQALEWAAQNGLRPLFPWEREAFSKVNPDLQRKFWLIDLGSFAGDGHRHVPVLGEDDDARRLGLRWFGNEWDADYRFLFVSK